MNDICILVSKKMFIKMDIILLVGKSLLTEEITNIGQRSFGFDMLGNSFSEHSLSYK